MGTLPRYYQGVCPPQGLEVEIASPATVADLVAQLGIPKEKIGVVSVNEMLAHAEDELPDQALVKLMQPIFGG